jgi:hypothetical protein
MEAYGPCSVSLFHFSPFLALDALDANGKPVLKPGRINGVYAITLDDSLDGRTAELPIGTDIFLSFPGENSKVIIKNPLLPWNRVVAPPGGTTSLPFGYTGVYQVVGQGTATITVTETVD